MTIWNPTLDGTGPVYRQLAQAIGDGIKHGALQAGQKLPTHRALAEQLGVTVGTITRAYAEAERQGFVSARIGDGTYIKSDETESALNWHIRQPDPNRIELWQNLPILQDKHGPFKAAIEALLEKPERINTLMEYSSVNGEPAQREIVCEWLSQYGFELHPDQIFFSFGSQNGLMLSLMACGAVGETILCEGLTYPGLMTLTHPLRIQLKGLAIDEEGLLPEALEKAAKTGLNRIIYLNPTIHNPTTSIMSLARRQQILEICQRYQIMIIEDDVHGTLPAVRPPTLHSLMPEQVIHLGSFAKNTSAGLRVGYMIVPQRLRTEMSVVVRGASWMITPLMLELTCHWLASGHANRLLLQQRNVLKQRGQLLRHYFKDDGIRYEEGGMHAWLPLPEQWRVAEFVQAADTQGIGIASGDLFTTNHYPAPSAIRLSISHPADNLSLDKALSVLKTLLQTTPQPKWVI